jgi:hypothetical protein
MRLARGLESAEMAESAEKSSFEFSASLRLCGERFLLTEGLRKHRERGCAIMNKGS